MVIRKNYLDKLIKLNITSINVLNDFPSDIHYITKVDMDFVLNNNIITESIWSDGVKSYKNGPEIGNYYTDLTDAKYVIIPNTYSKTASMFLCDFDFDIKTLPSNDELYNRAIPKELYERTVNTKNGIEKIYNYVKNEKNLNEILNELISSLPTCASGSERDLLYSKLIELKEILENSKLSENMIEEFKNNNNYSDDVVKNMILKRKRIDESIYLDLD